MTVKGATCRLQRGEPLWNRGFGEHEIVIDLIVQCSFRSCEMAPFFLSQMEKTMTAPCIAALGLLLALADCSSQPEDPVMGEWHGNQPGADGLVPNSVDLVLRGAPDAASGTYYIATVEHEARSAPGSRRWAGEWVRSQRVIAGKPLTVIDLHDALAVDISHYALMPDGTLHALTPDGTLGTDAASQAFALAPVPAGARLGRI
jgi:hypothetical protein